APAGSDTIAQPEGTAGPARFVERLQDSGLVLLVDVVLEGREGAGEARFGETANRLNVARPRNRVGGEVPGPDGDLRGFERSPNRGEIGIEGRRRLLARNAFRFLCRRIACRPVHAFKTSTSSPRGQGRLSNYLRETALSRSL